MAVKSPLYAATAMAETVVRQAGKYVIKKTALTHVKKRKFHLHQLVKLSRRLFLM
jgi:hypothetical protein